MAKFVRLGKKREFLSFFPVRIEASSFAMNETVEVRVGVTEVRS